MTLKDQWKTIKENWLIAIVIAALLIFAVFGGGLGSSIGGIATYKSAGGYGYDMAIAESAPMAASYRGVPSYDTGDFAPEVEERQIIKTASLGTEVKRGTFSSADSKLKAIATSSDSFILSENVNTNDQGWKSYKTGYYQLKVDTSKYDAVITQLKEIGEVQYFNENAQDVTGRYTNLQDELDAERARLQRYKQMYNEAERVEDKINLNDRIFNQERTIKYLEDAINNIDKRVEYSTVSVTINEKRSDYADIAFVKLSELVRKFVNSINGVLKLIFWAVPYAVALLIVWLVYKRARKKK